MTRQLVEHLPAMITPRWVRTKTQPIAVADVVRYLVAVLGMPQATGRTFEIGGPDVLEYVEIMRANDLIWYLQHTVSRRRARPSRRSAAGRRR